MKRRPPYRRRLAREDIEAAIDHYLVEAGERIALAFIDAVASAMSSIAEYPAAGSPKYGQDLRLPGLRSRPVRDFPYVIFYSDEGGRIEVWRVLHGHRDIPASLAEGD